MNFIFDLYKKIFKIAIALMGQLKHATLWMMRKSAKAQMQNQLRLSDLNRALMHPPKRKR